MAALPVHALTRVAAGARAVWEVGFDWWQLAPRGGILGLLGILLWPPPVRHGQRTSRRKPASGLQLAAAVLVCVGIAGYAMTQHPSIRMGALNSAAAASGGATGAAFDDGVWRQYGRTSRCQHSSPLAQITPANVASPFPARTYRTGDVKLPDDIAETTYQVTPIKVDDSFYICTSHTLAIALDAVTGSGKWRRTGRAGHRRADHHGGRGHFPCSGGG